MEIALASFSGFFVTWGIGLIPPLLLRFVIYKRQLSTILSIILIFVLLVINLIIFIIFSLAVSGEAGSHSALGLVAVVSYFILRAGNSRQIKLDTPKSQDHTNKLIKKLLFSPKSTAVFLVASVFFVGLFYWYELRPAKIRQECSWVKHTEAAIPVKPALGEKELKENGITRDCKADGFTRDCDSEGYRSIFCNENECERKNIQIIEEYKIARPAVPAKDWYSKASDKQYEFCIQEELANKAKIDFTTLNKIENSRRNPSLKTVDKIARALRVSTKDLL